MGLGMSRAVEARTQTASEEGRLTSQRHRVESQTRHAGAVRQRWAVEGHLGLWEQRSDVGQLCADAMKMTGEPRWSARASWRAAGAEAAS